MTDSAPATITEGVDANVTIKLSKLDELRDGYKRANDRIAGLEAMLVEEKQRDRTGEIAKLRALLRESFVVVRFAVANLPPETTKMWPTTALRLIIESLPLMPDFSVDDQAFINELRQFRREIFDIDRIRAARDEDAKRLAEISEGLDQTASLGEVMPPLNPPYR